MSEYESESSDLDEKLLPPKKEAKLPAKKEIEEEKSDKKLTTKLMIIDALIELKTRKGVSVYAIKKHLTEKFHVNTEKTNFIIKKTLRACVEDGTFVQTKGMGATGSFKVNPNKISKPKKSKIPKKVEKEPSKKIEKEPSKKIEKEPSKSIEKEPSKSIEKERLKKDGKERSKKDGKNKEKPGKTTKKATEKKQEMEKTKPMKTLKKQETEETKPKKILKKQNAVEEITDETVMTAVKKSKIKMADTKGTPSKKRAAMMKRKSIGSIIKPPKMKPKVK